jgi:signal transduction histidine kinase
MQDRSFSPTEPVAPAALAPDVSGAQRQELVSEFAAAGEFERQRVAESIHDDSIQVMAAMGMRLQMLRRSISDPEQLAMLTDAEQAVQLSIARLRHIVFELQPPGLEGEGLAVAIGIALEVTERASQAEYRLDDRFTSQPGTAQSALLFRIAQEALANVREHAGASQVTITLLERDGGHAVRVTDDGVGCQPGLAEPGSDGYGFASMRTRARLGGGSLSVESSPGAGTIVEAWLPRWEPPEPEAAQP